MTQNIPFFYLPESLQAFEPSPNINIHTAASSVLRISLTAVLLCFLAHVPMMFPSVLPALKSA